jgi:hypothetical protein
MTSPAPLEPHPDRLLPPDPGVRGIARWLYEAVRALPIVSPHGYVDPRRSSTTPSGGIVTYLDPDLRADADVTSAVREAAERLERL